MYHESLAVWNIYYRKNLTFSKVKTVKDITKIGQLTASMFQGVKSLARQHTRQIRAATRPRHLEAHPGLTRVGNWQDKITSATPVHNVEC